MAEQTCRPSVVPSPLPDNALLRADRSGEAYADCYVTEVDGAYPLGAFVEAFYTTALFRLERALLAVFLARPSTDSDARQLAQGRSYSFAAWRVEARSEDQLLLADFTGRTKSWLMVASLPSAASEARTRLYFGSAVVHRIHAPSGRSSMGFAFHALLGFHRLYSRLLLRAAGSRLLGSRHAAAPRAGLSAQSRPRR
ncbi:MAG: hypothetical protein V4792_00180 [Pseudomonadota bacterium]